MSAANLMLAANVVWSSCFGVPTPSLDSTDRGGSAPPAHQVWEQQLCRQLSAEGFVDVEYTVASQTAKLERSAPSAGQKIEIGELKAGRLMITVPAEKKPGKYQVREQVIWVKVKAYKSVWVAAQDVKAGEKVRKRDIAFRNVEIASFIGLANDNLRIASPIGHRAKNALKKGSVITDGSLLSSPHMRRGAVVDVTIARGPVRIEAKGKVLTDVYDVQRVYVKLDHNNVQMLGALTSSGKILVQL